MALVCTTKVENKIHKNAGSLLEGPVIARIRRPIAKIGLCSIQNKGSCFSKGNIDDGINENGLSYFCSLFNSRRVTHQSITSIS